MDRRDLQDLDEYARGTYGDRSEGNGCGAVIAIAVGVIAGIAAYWMFLR